MPYLTVNGATLYYEDRGSGDETVVFAHSLLFSCRMFDDQVRVLEERYRCISFDFRGQGQSEVTDDGYDMNSLAEDARAVIEALDAAPCHFVGFSMGGFVGLRLAIRYPELLRSLILIDSSADPEPRENLREYRMMTFVARWIGPRIVAGRVMPIMFSEHFLTDPACAEKRREWHGHLASNHRIGGTRAVKGVITREAVAEQLGEIRHPTLIIAGENDIAITPDRSVRMHERIPDSRMITIPRTGHMSPVEEPEAVTEALVEFLVQVGVGAR